MPNKNDKYGSILASLVTYIQSVDTWYQYLVFITLILFLLLGLDIVINHASIIKRCEYEEPYE